MLIKYLYTKDQLNSYPYLQNETKIKIPGGRYQNCCVFNKTGKVLATAGVGGSVYLWSKNNTTKNWEQVAELPYVTMPTVTTISWDPSSQYICTGQSVSCV
jgi:WD40 repeat protein